MRAAGTLPQGYLLCWRHRPATAPARPRLSHCPRIAYAPDEYPSPPPHFIPRTNTRAAETCAAHSYNEVSFYALNIIHPVTHALGNTLKRVVMIIVSVLVLNHKFTPLGLAGCTTAIGGVMAYSITKARLESSGVVVPVGKLAEARAAAAKEEQAKGAAAAAAAADGKGETEEEKGGGVGDAVTGKGV